MSPIDGPRVRVVRALAAGLALATLACRVPREVHEPREYPARRLPVREVGVVVSDPRPALSGPSRYELSLPASFEPRVRARLAKLAAGSGPSLEVRLVVAALDELEVVDARGEMTRVVARFHVEVRHEDGVVLRRAETQSSADLPRDEASAEEVSFVLDATALDAVDRYFADERLIAALDRDLAAHASR